MKEVPISNSERQFILQAIKNQRRLDGRSNDEYRQVKIHFGADWGSVLVSLGETKVLAQVSCELGIPKAVRPNEGMLYINVEIGAMAAPHFESRNSELHVQINRTLERNFKDSRAVDLESLCVRAEEHVWILRVDLNVLNHEGNLIDCCSIASLAALSHFRRPDVSIEETGVRVHTAAEKELLPLVLNHHPVCVSYATFNDGKNAVVDPNYNEERTCESQMIFGLNAHRELCCLNLGGSSLTSSNMLLQCATRAAVEAKKIVELVKQALKADAEARKKGEKVGFSECLKSQMITGLSEERFELRLPDFKLAEAAGRVEPMLVENADGTTQAEVVALDGQSAILFGSTSNERWMPDGADDSSDSDAQLVDMESDANESDNDDDRVFNSVLKRLEGEPKPAVKNDDSDSEEEQKMTV